MHDSPTHEREPHAPLHASKQRVPPSSSKMLSNYLADIEQLLDEQSWETAIREARDLPLIAVAIADAHLRSSGINVQKWCADWVRPVRTDGDSRSTDIERISAQLLDKVDGSEDVGTVPAAALRQLRLRRLARTPPSRFPPPRARSLTAQGNEAMDFCTTVVDAVRRWYAHFACRDPIVQANLARLAVLR
jgi:hypothetical protein